MKAIHLPETPHPDSMGSAASLDGYMLSVEPVAYLKGGVDGDRLDAFVAQVDLRDQEFIPGEDAVRRIFGAGVGIDSVGYFLFLEPDEGVWRVRTEQRVELRLRPSPIRQFFWKAAVDSMRSTLHAGSLDSTLSRSDLVAVVENISGRDRHCQARVKHVLHETAQTDSVITIRLYAGWPADGPQVVCLKRLAAGDYEPIPPTRTVIPYEWDGHRADDRFVDTYDRVQRALDRLRAAGVIQ
jgi:hypothetical protein